MSEESKRKTDTAAASSESIRLREGSRPGSPKGCLLNLLPCLRFMSDGRTTFGQKEFCRGRLEKRPLDSGVESRV